VDIGYDYQNAILVGAPCRHFVVCNQRAPTKDNSMSCDVSGHSKSTSRRTCEWKRHFQWSRLFQATTFPQSGTTGKIEQSLHMAKASPIKRQDELKDWMPTLYIGVRRRLERLSRRGGAQTLESCNELASKAVLYAMTWVWFSAVRYNLSKILL